MPMLLISAVHANITALHALNEPFALSEGSSAR
jgi:hypothetical protein